MANPIPGAGRTRRKPAKIDRARASAREGARAWQFIQSDHDLKPVVSGSKESGGTRLDEELSRFSNTSGISFERLPLRLASRVPSLAQCPQLLDIREKVFRWQARES
jgi:hypothetical protein